MLSIAQEFAKRYGDGEARFALIRVWEPPHFHPLMIGWDKGAQWSFFACTGRAWEWKFVPKDMPYSEWSIFYACKLRTKPFERQLGAKVRVGRGFYLVMVKR